MSQSWTSPELRAQLARFERELRAAGLRPSSVATYVDRTAVFLRWLDGDYAPRGSRVLTSPDPPGVAEVSDLDTFRALRTDGVGVFVIADRPTGRTVIHGVTCPFITETSFTTKVLDGGSRNGRYLWAPSAEDALQVPGAIQCRHPSDPG
jgi:hypothetical protein